MPGRGGCGVGMKGRTLTTLHLAPCYIRSSPLPISTRRPSRADQLVVWLFIIVYACNSHADPTHRRMLRASLPSTDNQTKTIATEAFARAISVGPSMPLDHDSSRRALLATTNFYVRCYLTFYTTSGSVTSFSFDVTLYLNSVYSVVGASGIVYREPGGGVYTLSLAPLGAYNGNTNLVQSEGNTNAFGDPAVFSSGGVALSANTGYYFLAYNPNHACSGSSDCGRCECSQACRLPACIYKLCIIHAVLI